MKSLTLFPLFLLPLLLLANLIAAISAPSEGPTNDPVNSVKPRDPTTLTAPNTNITTNTNSTKLHPHESLHPQTLKPGRLLCSPHNDSPRLADVRLAATCFSAVCDPADPPVILARGCKMLSFHGDAVIGMCGLTDARMPCGDVDAAVAMLGSSYACGGEYAGGHVEFEWGIVVVWRGFESGDE